MIIPNYDCLHANPPLDNHMKSMVDYDCPHDVASIMSH